MSTAVPFLDLKAHHAPLREEFLKAIATVIDRGAFAGGPFVAEFERDFAAFCGVPFACGVGNGTDALWLSLLALGVGPGDEVITVPSTFMATAEAITYCGARPVFVDIDEQTYTMDPALLGAAITPRTRAIIPVHLFGQIADMDPILEIAARHGIPVVEDACQAHGAEYKGRAPGRAATPGDHEPGGARLLPSHRPSNLEPGGARLLPSHRPSNLDPARQQPHPTGNLNSMGGRAGSFGIAGCFSFYPGKNLGAFGEAGGVVTSSPELLRKIQAFRDHGQTRKYHHTVVGWNARMDGIQGAVLALKLKHLARNNEARRAHALAYNRALSAVEEVITPTEAPYGNHVYHVYAVRVQNRDRVLESLGARGVQCGIHYPVPVHLQEAYAFLGHRRGAFPIAERCADEFLSLPMFPELTADQIERVVAELKACLEPDRRYANVA